MTLHTYTCKTVCVVCLQKSLHSSSKSNHLMRMNQGSCMLVVSYVLVTGINMLTYNKSYGVYDRCFVLVKIKVYDN